MGQIYRLIYDLFFVYTDSSVNQQYCSSVTESMLCNKTLLNNRPLFHSHLYTKIHHLFSIKAQKTYVNIAN